jgi:hypothetical protein
MLIDIVTMKQCVRSKERNKVVPEIPFVAVFKLKSLTHYVGGVHSCAKPTLLWCKSGLCPHAWHTSYILPSAKASMIHWVLSPNWKKFKKLGVICLTWQLTAPPSELVPQSHKCLMCPQVPHKGTQEHEALAQMEYKLWRWGQSLWNKVL